MLQPDCGQTGGITQMKKIAALCEAYLRAARAALHFIGAGTQSASLQAAAVVPFFLIHEAYLDGHIMPPGVARKQWQVDSEGYASLPMGPGLGVEMDEQKIAEVAADPKRVFKWPTPRQPDGSVTDY